MNHFLALLLLTVGLLAGVLASDPADPLMEVDGPCGNDCCLDNICCGPGTVWYHGRCVPVRTISPKPFEVAVDWADKCFLPKCVAEECCAEDTELSVDPTRDPDACWCIFDSNEPTASPTTSPSATQTFAPTSGPCEKKGSFVVNGSSMGTAKKFAKPDGTMPTDEELKDQADYVKRYDGKTSFSAEYQISLDKDGKLITTKSWVQFTLICFTDNGSISKEAFKTEKITITKAVIDADCTNLKSFDMASTSWYNKADAKTFDLDKQDLTGSINFVTKKASWVAEYGTKAEGITSSYTITGDIADKTDDCK